VLVQLYLNIGTSRWGLTSMEEKQGTPLIEVGLMKVDINKE